MMSEIFLTEHDEAQCDKIIISGFEMLINKSGQYEGL
jgi:hypothetical protein